MNSIKVFLALGLLTSSVWAVGTAKQTCCQEAATKSKDCRHKCCVAAHREGKSCNKCNPNKEDLKLQKNLNKAPKTASK